MIIQKKKKTKTPQKKVRDTSGNTTSNKIFKISNRSTCRYVTNATLCLLGWDEAGGARLSMPDGAGAADKQTTYGRINKDRGSGLAARRIERNREGLQQVNKKGPLTHGCWYVPE